METIYLLIFFLMLAWFWYSTIKARDLALGVCKRACRDMDVQLLDDTVALRRIGIKRNKVGRLQVRRLYGFEYSTDNQTRIEGCLIMLGSQVETLITSTDETRPH